MGRKKPALTACGCCFFVEFFTVFPTVSRRSTDSHVSRANTVTHLLSGSKRVRRQASVSAVVNIPKGLRVLLRDTSACRRIGFTATGAGADAHAAEHQFVTTPGDSFYVGLNILFHICLFLLFVGCLEDAAEPLQV